MKPDLILNIMWVRWLSLLPPVLLIFAVTVAIAVTTVAVWCSWWLEDCVHHHWNDKMHTILRTKIFFPSNFCTYCPWHKIINSGITSAVAGKIVSALDIGEGLISALSSCTSALLLHSPQLLQSFNYRDRVIRSEITLPSTLPVVPL